MNNIALKILGVMVFLGPINFAIGSGEHREHAAHVHGSARLEIAFEDLKGRVEFKAASDGVVGFEHQAKSAKDKKILQEALAKMEKMDRMVQFDSTLGCSFKRDKVEMVRESNQDSHSNIVATFDVLCQKSILGSQLKVDFSPFPNLRDIDITVLVGGLQKSVESKGKPLSIHLQ